MLRKQPRHMDFSHASSIALFLKIRQKIIEEVKIIMDLVPIFWAEDDRIYNTRKELHKFVYCIEIVMDLNLQ